MASLHILVSLLSLALSGVIGAEVSSQGHPNLTVVQGEEVKLKCSSPQKIIACYFRSPSGGNYFMFEGSSHEEGRVYTDVITDYECGLAISNIKDNDNGKWECALTFNENGQTTSGQDFFHVTVAVPPTDVILKIGDSQALQEYQVNMKEHENGEMVKVECVALEARPPPSFVWSIGDTSPIKGVVTDRVENFNEKTGKADYVQTLEYYPKTAHNHHELKCTVNHLGFAQNQIEERANEAMLTLNILYAPQVTGKEEVFYDLKEGLANTIPMKVYANPKPSKGIWKLGENELAVGAESLDKKFKSTVLTEGAIDGEWLVSLTINNLKQNDTQVKYKLIISNEEGSAEYGFKLALGAGPANSGGFSSVVAKGESSSSMAIGVIVVIALVVILLVLIAVARAKGLICFGGKAPKPEDTEHAVEKEGSDTESTEHQTSKSNTEGDRKDQEEQAEDGKQEVINTDQEDSKKVSMATKMTNLFAAVRKSVKPKERKYEQSESEVKLNDADDKKDVENGDKDQVDYVELDKNALNSGPKSNFKVEVESKTVYEEIKPQ